MFGIPWGSSPIHPDGWAPTGLKYLNRSWLVGRLRRSALWSLIGLKTAEWAKTRPAKVNMNRYKFWCSVKILNFPVFPSIIFIILYNFAKIVNNLHVFYTTLLKSQSFSCILYNFAQKSIIFMYSVQLCSRVNNLHVFCTTLLKSQ